jgi:monoamine oxidase
VERRDFLRGLGRALRHPLQESERAYLEGPRPLPAERVLVLGAGAAGLGAARALRAEGVQVTVLEARERVGGRAWTVDGAGVPVDQGATRLHGTDGNPLVDVADFAGLGLIASDPAAAALLATAGALDEDAVEAAFGRYDRLLAELVGLRDRLGPSASVADALGAAGWDAGDEAVRLLLHAELEVTSAADVDRLALATLLAGGRLPGDDVLVLEGLGTVVAGLADDADVRFGEVVEHVEQLPDGVRVTTTAGVHEAERAIVTLPLGVLASGTVRFDPALPDAVLDAAQALDPGELTTVAVRLDEPLLPAGAEFASVAADVGTWAVLDDSVEAPLLVGWAVGATAARLPEDDATVVRDALGALARGLRVAAPEPRWFAVARWGDDPFARGARSFVPAGVDPAVRAVLGGAVSDRLLLAGEASSTEWPATVHGALASGEREAQRCMVLMREEN